MAQIRPGDWYEVIVASFQQMASTVVSYIPNVVGALVILIAGWLIGRVIQGAARRIMRWTKIEDLLGKSRLDETLREAEIKTTTADLICKLVYWIVFVVFLIAAADTLGLGVVRTKLADFVGYIPNVIAAVLILAFGAYIARIVRDALTAGMLQAHLGYGHAVGRVAEVALMVFVVVVALRQLGLDVGVLVSNVTVIVAGIMLAIALSFGLGARDILGNLVAAYYVRQLIKVGDELRAGGHTGKVEQLKQTCVVLDTPDGKVLVPNRDVVTGVTGPSRGALGPAPQAPAEE